MNQCLCCREETGVRGLTAPNASDQAMAARIVNIAGIASGTRVVCLDENVASPLALAATAAGARVWAAAHEDIDRTRRQAPVCNADVLLCRTDTAPHDPVAAACHKWLRIGGRLVLWSLPPQESDACRLRSSIARIVHGPGFTSAIVGQLPPEEGGAVIATGILIVRTNGRLSGSLGGRREGFQ